MPLVWSVGEIQWQMRRICSPGRKSKTDPDSTCCPPFRRTLQPHVLAARYVVRIRIFAQKAGVETLWFLGELAYLLDTHSWDLLSA
ncbi:hypothetical protein SCP_0102420 [Sparassis crispa]|uniref:Uncharacterized protein n=1 Tax=Sparassis crispa TaxID=139825 RepID=A0A401G5D5_9APHY|nr:hypothetical protein SCP_0102420 [Sparassis crispa]GBE77369.1 hypothetical protein SCP_0102420 [Sparassis crispa]